MAEIVLERRTWNPTGRAEDERFFEVVVQDSSPLPASDPTPRITAATRLFTRGDYRSWGDRERDYLLTTGSNSTRVIVAAMRVSPTRGGFDEDITALGLQLRFPITRGERTLVFDFYGGPARGATIANTGVLFDEYKVRQPYRA